MDKRFSQTYAFVQAAGYEQLCLWRECHKELGWPWVQDNNGRDEVIGEKNGQPLRLQFFWNTIAGKLIAFYDMAGGVFDYWKTQEWLETNFPNAKIENAMNFHNVFRR